MSVVPPVLNMTRHFGEEIRPGHSYFGRMAPLTADQVFLSAQAAWTDRAQPAYESFTLPCAATFLAPQCAPEVQVRFIVRMADGRTFAQTIARPGAPAKILVRGGYITGPADAPLGFFRRVPDAGAEPAKPPPNLAADPLRTIATVTATDYAYDIRIAGKEKMGGIDTIHLTLVPLREPDLYPLRDLWVAADSHEIVRLVYERPYANSTARITYDFMPVGTPPVWSIVHIAASTSREAVSESLNDLTFPQAEPDSLFDGEAYQ